MIYTITFETETYLPIFTRINSMLFRKRIVPIRFSVEKDTEINGYKAEFVLDANEDAIHIVKRQLERLVGVARVQIKTT